MKKLFVFVLFIIINSTIGYPQGGANDTYKEMFLDGEFFLYEEEYVDALSFYQKLYKRGYQDNANINYRMGICYLNIPGQKNQSIQYLENASTKADNSYKEGVFKQDKAPIDVFIYLGNAYRVNNRLDDAIKIYEKYKTLIDEKKVAEKNFANQQIQACKTAKMKMKQPKNITFTNLGKIINTPTSDYNPVVSGDGNSIVYMHELPFYNAIYYSIKNENGEWKKPRNITPEVQSDGDMLTHFLSYDGKIMVLSREDAFNSDIWISKRTNGGTWGKATPLDKTINTKFWESHASLSPDNKKIYFASNRKNGFGLMDIYVCELDENNFWSNPKNIGNAINTELNEDCPVISSDGKTLYFTSQGHDCMGGYDIFFSTLNNDSTWSKPVNMGYPLNTTDDETFFYPGKEPGEGYIARLATDSYGKEDIYFVTLNEFIVPETVAEVTKDTIAETVPEVVAQVEPEQITEPEPVVEPEPETVKEPIEEIKPEIKTFEISPIYFNFNSVGLTAEAKTELNKIIEILKEYPSLKVELNGYTDSKGSDEINKIISQQRARATHEYLIKNEIGISRIKIYGYGNTGYIAINSNPDGSDSIDGRKYNRRVEIKFSNIEDNVKILEKVDVPENLKFK